MCFECVGELLVGLLFCFLWLNWCLLYFIIMCVYDVFG